MNTHTLQNCSQPTTTSGFDRLTDRLIGAIRFLLDDLRGKHEQRKLYRYYRGLNAERLRDIGMDDPAVQLRVLGRYL